MHIAVIGANHKLAGLKLREALARAAQRQFALGANSQFGSSFIPLCTCNRTEIYFSAPSLAEAHSEVLARLRREIEGEFDQKLYSYFDVDCFHHLAQVTSGLDSAIVGETEIQGQVKQAYLNAASTTHLPSPMHYLFQKALQIGKKIRSTYSLREGATTLEQVMMETIGDKQKRILFLGASEINVRIVQRFWAHGFRNLAICNRTASKATSLAKERDLLVIPWEERGRWPLFDVAIFGTCSPNYLARSEELRGGQPIQLIFDLSVPRNVDPSIGREVSLYNIDQIDRQVERQSRLQGGQLEEACDFVRGAIQRSYTLYLRKVRNLDVQMQRAS